MNSNIKKIINLHNVDWNSLKEKCELNIIYEIAECWNQGIYRAKDIGDIVGLDKSPVRKYLNKCEEFGLIEKYDKNITESIRKTNANMGIYQNQATPIKCNENDLYFGSVAICKRTMSDITGKKFAHSNILGTITGEYSHHHHFTFTKVTKEEFNRIKSENPDKAFGDYFILDNQKSA